MTESKNASLLASYNSSCYFSLTPNVIQTNQDSKSCFLHFSISCHLISLLLLQHPFKISSRPVNSASGKIHARLRAKKKYSFFQVLLHSHVIKLKIDAFDQGQLRYARVNYTNYPEFKQPPRSADSRFHLEKWFLSGNTSASYI